MPLSAPLPLQIEVVPSILYRQAFECQHLVCGRIIWIGDAARRPALCGKIIVWGLRALGRNEWAVGSILDPDDDRTYRLAATQEPDGTLHARIFKGVTLFGRTEILKCVDIRFHGPVLRRADARNGHATTG